MVGAKGVFPGDRGPQKGANDQCGQVGPCQVNGAIPSTCFLLVGGNPQDSEE